ncbi:MAG TPA: hypothetical protein PLP50_07935 [Thermoanaerobaculia bacterium]|jgi:hypothetical protein|nr:hypothetical protein [Thermoanaerobaculia bacterium]HPA51517.1 hypothetical protein [Thermoanaerobaculia bacterium]HQN07542.1 hypothetical protein [Thermoanaerobaculia bacterium]HQP86499.1 hypothetical protein [Thermoanaerobaculia bacterium]
MSGSARALLERLGSLVPGYAGYADRETRRECDQALRLAVASRLGAARATLDRRTADCARTGRLDLLEPLDSISRRVAALADALRHAPAGYAALFDAATVDAAQLDRIYAFDLEMKEAGERVFDVAERVRAGVDAEALDALNAAVAAAEESLRRRGEVLREVR